MSGMWKKGTHTSPLKALALKEENVQQMLLLVSTAFCTLPVVPRKYPPTCAAQVNKPSRWKHGPAHLLRSPVCSAQVSLLGHNLCTIRSKQHGGPAHVALSQGSLVGSPGGGSKDISPGWDTRPCGKRLQVSWAARAALHAAAPGKRTLKG